MKFKSAVFAISILSSFSAFADSAPIEVSNEQVTRYVQFTNQTITVLYIRAVDDNVLINTIKANRGNCKILHIYRFSNPMKFGEQAKVDLYCPYLKEVTVIANKKPYTFKF